MRVPGIAVLQHGVRRERSMGVAQWVEASAVVLAGAGRLRLGHASSGIWERGRLGVRETRVKPVLPAMVPRETYVKRQSRPPGWPLRPQRRNLATSSNSTAPQPRGISRKPCPCLVRGYEPR